ncbi:HAMP domain-containing histidine kinase [Ruminococcaceae bacterium OttesenSCG-928-A16]|nr:HAMP domain-containing histidine kinase [Ruminococcaceae bacterium OttesenSCG-928-A16]
MAFHPYTPFIEATYPCFWLAYNGDFWKNDAAQKMPAAHAVETLLHTIQTIYKPLNAPFSVLLPGGGSLTISPLPAGLLATAGNETLLSSGTVGSQLREPLSSIFAVLPLLSRKVDESGLRYTEEIQNSCYNLLRLASNLESSSSLGHGSFFEQPVDITLLTESIFSCVETVCRQQNIPFTLDIPSYPLPVRGNKRLLTEAILNILRNSIQYTRDGNHISIQLQEAAGKAIVTIQDHGLGIKAEHAPHLFEAYFSANPYGDGAPPPGAGLGLTVAYQAARSFGGSIHAESEFGSGTTIRLALPLHSGNHGVLGSSPADYLLNRYSPVYVQLSGYCQFPDL